MKHIYSLKRNKEFRYVYRVGKSVGSSILVMIYTKSRGKQVHIGFSISKKLGNAVNRNRIKRRLREAVTPLLADIESGHDIIFIAREPVVKTEFSTIVNTMHRLLSKGNLLKGDPERL